MTPDPIRRTPTRMRRAIVKSMNASALVPQFTIESDASVDALAGLRREQAATGVTVSYSDLFVAATARALKLHPGLNSSYGDDAILEHQVVNIGLAVALEDGLIAPAIRDADQLTLAQIVEARERLTAAAQAGTLTPEDVFSTTFTISNLGPYGVRRFRALVVPPQAAILALGRSRRWAGVAIAVVRSPCARRCATEPSSSAIWSVCSSAWTGLTPGLVS